MTQVTLRYRDYSGAPSLIIMSFLQLVAVNKVRNSKCNKDLWHENGEGQRSKAIDRWSRGAEGGALLTSSKEIGCGHLLLAK